MDITTAPLLSPQCGAGTGTQLLGLEAVLDQRTGTFQTLTSYVYLPVTSDNKTPYSLERLYCPNANVSLVPTNVTTIAYDLPSPTSANSPRSRR